jgi:hypothetical protein
MCSRQEVDNLIKLSQHCTKCITKPLFIYKIIIRNKDKIKIRGFG